MKWSWPKIREGKQLSHTDERRKQDNRLARFGPFELDVPTGELWNDGQPVPLQSQPFRILLLLVSNPHELVTREDIRGTLWDENPPSGSDNSINASMNKLRTALGDSPQSPQFIETLARRGYRMKTPVEWSAKPGAETSSAAPKPWFELLRRGRRAWPWQFILTSLFLALLAVMLAVEARWLS